MTLFFFLRSLLNLLQYCFCFMLWLFGPEACGILVPPPGIEPAPLALEGDVFTTGPPGKPCVHVNYYGHIASPFLLLLHPPFSASAFTFTTDATAFQKKKITVLNSLLSHMNFRKSILNFTNNLREFYCWVRFLLELYWIYKLGRIKAPATLSFHPEMYCVLTFIYTFLYVL